MEKKKTKKINFFKVLSIIFVAIFSSFSLYGCMGGGTYYGSSSGGSSGGSSSKPSTGGYNKPTGPNLNTDDGVNNLFMGAIGVYDIDIDDMAFFDNYIGQAVSFNTLANRQFDTLASIIYQTLNQYYGTGSLNRTIYGYTTAGNTYSNSTILDVDDITIYGSYNTLNYFNSIEGGYVFEKIEEEQTDENGDVLYGEDGEPLVTVTYRYNVDQLNTSNRWEKHNFTKESITNALRYIYNHPYACNTPNTLALYKNNDPNSAMKEHYKGFYGLFKNNSEDNNKNVKTLGFSEVYMWNVLYYVAYSLVGETVINNSITSAPYVFNGNNLNTVTEDNYKYFEVCKGYERVIPNIISNAFKLVLENGQIVRGDYYCFDISNYDKFYNKTLFPILDRSEYIFFDDVRDVCDAEDPEWYDSSGNTNSNNNSSYEDDDYDYEYEPFEVGTLRRLKKIILIPQIDRTKYEKNDFSIELLLIAMVGESNSDFSAEGWGMTSHVVDKDGKEKTTKMVFEDFDSEEDEPDYLSINRLVDATGNSSKRQASTYRFVQACYVYNELDAERNMIETNSELYKYSSVSDSICNNIRDSFTDYSYNMTYNNNLNYSNMSADTFTTTINAGRLNVCNKLFTLTLDDTSTNGVNNSIKFGVDNKNYIEFKFDYYSYSGKVSDPAEVYLMYFTIE